MGRRKREEGVNGKLCAMLNILAEYEKLVTNNTYKANAYRQASLLLSKHPCKVKSGEEAKKLGKIGASIAEKIDQYVSTGRIPKVEQVKSDERFKAILMLTQVSGIGPTKARELVDKGVRTIDDLRRCTDALNRHQLIGLKYFDVFQLKIPRAEIDAIERVLIEEIAKIDCDFVVTICGSYRRGKPSSGDVDCLITHPGLISESSSDAQTSSEISLRKIVSGLKKGELVVDTIGLGQTKFMGVCKLNERKPPRRIDIRLVPIDQYYCALLYFTGSELFNRNMRTHALSQGYSLNEYTLRPIGSTGKLGKPVPVKSERDIFERINYPYKPPHERDA